MNQLRIHSKVIWVGFVLHGYLIADYHEFTNDNPIHVFEHEHLQILTLQFLVDTFSMEIVEESRQD